MIVYLVGDVFPASREQDFRQDARTCFQSGNNRILGKKFPELRRHPVMRRYFWLLLFFINKKASQSGNEFQYLIILQ